MRTATVAPVTASSVPNPTLAGFLQRECSCGGSAGVSGECAECEQERRFGQGVQPKLRVNAPGDRYEQEADRLAGEVVGGSPIRPGSPISQGITPLVQRDEAPASGESEEDEEEPVQRQAAQAEEEEPAAGAEALEDEEEPLQTFRPDIGTAGPLRPGRAFQARLRTEMAGGRPLEPGIRNFMEARLGAGLGDVRVHTGAAAARLSSFIRAHAFTLGQNIFFATGMYSPGTAGGRRLLAHELVHTMQQAPGHTGGGAPSGSRTGSSVDPEPSGSALGQDPAPIGSPDDPSETEADRAARAVGAMGPLAPAAPAQPSGHRDGDRAQRGGRPSRARLEHGGSPLPSVIRDELEPRFDRDFSRVRIHTGKEASLLNDRIGSTAFAYGAHIWLGAREPLALTETMAHELAHVVQQSNPPAVGNRAAGGTGGNPVVRGKFYLEPSGWSGTKTHRKVLPEVRKANRGNVFVEAPVPNATRKGSGAGHTDGRADLMSVSARRAVGVRFDDQKIPQPLSGPAPSDNPRYNHAIRSAPFSEAANRIKRIAKGAARIQVADLKPAPASPSGTRGKTQIRNYVAGLTLAHTLTNQWADAQPKPPKHWEPFSASAWTGIKVPKKLRGSDFHKQDLVVKEFTWHQDEHDAQKWRPSMTVYKPPTAVKGHLVVEKPTSSPEIIQYRWKPSYAYKPSRITAAVGKLDKDLDPLLKDLRSLNTKKVSGRFVRRSRAGAPAAGLRPAPRMVQRKKTKPKDTKVNDTFDAKTWETKRSALKTKYGHTPGAADARLQYYLAETDKDTGGRDGFAQAATDRHLKTVGKLEFWTGSKARFLGILREKFGAVAVKVFNAAHSFRSKLVGLLEKKKGKEPGATSYAKVAIRAILRALTRLAEPIFRQSVSVVADSFRSGVSKQFNDVFPLDDPSTLYEELLKEEVEQFPAVQQLQKAVGEAGAKVDALQSELEQKFGPLFAFIAQLRSKAETVGTIIKVAMVAIQCASPPIIGCLKLAASTAISHLADKVLAWCSIQKRFQGLVLELDAVKSLPKTIAKQFVDVLPADPVLEVAGKKLSVQGLFDRTVLDTAKPAQNVDCDDPSKDGTTDPRHEAIADLMTEMGCDHDPASDSCKKVAALGELMSKRGVHSRALTPEEIRGLAPLLKSKGFTAADLEAAALASGKSKTMTVQDFLKQLPGWVKKGQARKQFFAAKKSFGKDPAAGLSPGDIRLRTEDLDWAKLKSSGENKDVGVVLQATKDHAAFGVLDLTDVTGFACPGQTKITFTATTTNVRITDAAGNPVQHGREGQRGGWTYTGSSDRFKKARKILCP